MKRWQVRVAGLRGWRRLAIAWLTGALLAAALPPWNVPLVLPLAFTLLIWMLDGCDGWRGGAAVAWGFGLGSFMAGLHWLAYPMLVDPARFGWMIPFAVTGLPAVLAIVPGLAGALYCVHRVSGWRRILWFAALWSAGEYGRGHLFTGFPWNLIGYAWTWVEPLMQPAAYLGVYGLGFVTVVIAAAPAVLTDQAPPRRRWAPVGLATAVLAVLFGAGLVRLATTPPVETSVALRIVQPSIPQRLKWLEGERERNLRRHVELSRGAAPGAIVVWPETASSYALDVDGAAREVVAAAVPPGGMLFTGAPRFEENGSELRIFNSLLAITAEAEVAGRYDKRHLVPFGEYLPFRGLLARLGVEKLVASSALDFSTGTGAGTLAVTGFPPANALICYEVIFPAEVAATERPAWLLSVTNDAWFGPDAGPAQHFAMARMRAVEHGLPLVRAANTGISGVVDGLGRIVATLGIDHAGVIDARLPAAQPPTFYSQWRDAAFFVFLLLAGVAALSMRKRMSPVRGG
jgi:apolipoprotein N-acyltransferase